MPGNEVEDRVHNFFAQEDLSSNHHQSQAADGNWPGQGTNLWPGSHMQIGLPSSNSKSYNLQQSERGQGQNSHSFQVAHGLNYAQPHSENQLRNSNGYIHGRQVLQTRQNEANFLGINTESDRHTMTSRGLPIYESQGRNGLENNVASVRSESSESRIGFDFLGGQQQQMAMPQNLPPQQLSGFNDIQLLQQQAMMRKMHELQRHQLEAMNNNSLNQNNPSIINGTPISANNSWLNRATQGPSNELRFPAEQGQTLSLMGLTPQRSDQSLYGVPVSNTRGTSSHYSHVSADNKMGMFSNSSPGDQYRGPIDHVNAQGGFQEENLFGQLSGQSLVRGVYSENPQLVHPLQRDAPVQEFAGLSEKMERKTVVQVSSSQNSVALDPTEEKILFGNGNIWDSFGDSDDIGAGGGTWSALMQSAVGETEEWSGPNNQNTEVSLSSLSDNIININKSFHGVPVFQQDVQKYSSDGTQIYPNTMNSSDGINAKSMLGSWSPQQNVTSPISGQIYGKPDGRNDVKTLSSGNENRMLHMSQGVHMWKPIPGPQARASMGSLQGNREEEILSNNSGRSNSGTNNSNLPKQVEPSKMRKRNENHLNTGSLVLESSMNGLGNDVVNMHERESNERENSSESHHSNISQHTTTAGCSNDKVRLDGSDTRNLLGGKQKEQGGPKLPGPRKFQYHPMGNSDGDDKASFRSKPVSTNQSQGYLGQSNSYGQFPKASNEIEKGNIFGVQQNKKGGDVLPARRTLAGFAPIIKQSSQNVLDFPRSTDQSKENSNSDKSIGSIKQSQSPSPHGFGLQLGFPSQLLPPQNQALSGPPSSHTTPEIREKMDNTSQAPSYPSFHEIPQGEYKKNGTTGAGSSNNNFPPSSMMGSFDSASNSRFPISRNQLEGQPHNKFPPSIFRPGKLNKSTAPVQPSQQTGGEDRQANVPFADVAPKPSVSQGKESVVKNQSENSPSNSASTESDFEAFGRSLKPSNLPSQSYSLLNQMRVMKSTEIDPNIRDLKRFKGAESSVRPHNTILEDHSKLSFSGSVGSVDNRHPSSLLVHRRMDSGNYNCATSTSSVKVENSNISPQMAPSWFEQYGTFKNGHMLSMYNAHKQTNLKTAEQQRLPLGASSDTLRANIIKAQSTVASDSVLVGNIWQRTILPPETVEKLPSPQIEAYDVTDKALVVPKVKKRKSVAPLLSWHKEVTQGSQSLLTLRMAEEEWARASNRITDKVEDESGTSEDGQPRRRSKRRLIMTTQLMQQLFRPPVARILSDDVYSNYEAVACMSARLALGDSCTLMPSLKADSCAPLDNINSSIDTHKTSDSQRTSDQRLSEVMEQFIGRAKKLESDFLRLDKRVSVVDLRVETQELDKISVINRFARVHGRGQGDLAAPPGPQRYVNALPIPRVLPERVQCLSL